MKIRVMLEKTDLRVGLAWDRHRRIFVIALPFLHVRFELGGGFISAASQPALPIAAGMHPDDAALLAAIRHEPHLHWQELRVRVQMSATRAVHARERLLAVGAIEPARNNAGQRVLKAVDS